jgi:hypothetical protein
VLTWAQPHAGVRYRYTMLFNVDDDVKVRCNSGWARGWSGSNGAEPQTPDSCRVDGEEMDDRCGHIDQEREPFKPDLAVVHLSKRAGPLRLRLRISTQRASAEARDPVRMRETNNIALQVAPIHAARNGKHHPDRQHALNGVP